MQLPCSHTGLLARFAAHGCVWSVDAVWARFHSSLKLAGSSRYLAWKGGFEALVGVGDNPGILKSPGERPARKQPAAPVAPPIILRTSPLPLGAVEPPAGVKVADAEAAVQPYIAAKARLPLAAALTLVLTRH